MKKSNLNKFKFLSFLLFGTLFLTYGCNIPNSAYFQKEVSVKDGQWASDMEPVFTLNIKDTTCEYQTYILLRNSDDYPYSNIWLMIRVKKPGATSFPAIGKRINLKLANVKGVWLGKGMGSIWEHKIPLNNKDNLHFEKPGTYQIQITQIMRNDPLQGILNAGIIVEKSSLKKKS